MDPLRSNFIIFQNENSHRLEETREDLTVNEMIFSYGYDFNSILRDDLHILIN